MVFDSFVEVLEAPDCLEPDADLDPDAPVVAVGLSSVDDSADLEPVDVGASVIVPLAESEAVEEGVAVLEVSGGDDVCEGASKNVKNQHEEYDNRQRPKLPVEELSCLLTIKASMSLDESGHGHAAAKLTKKRNERSRKRPEPFIVKVARFNRYEVVEKQTEFDASMVRDS